MKNSIIEYVKRLERVEENDMTNARLIEKVVAEVDQVNRDIDEYVSEQRLKKEEKKKALELISQERSDQELLIAEEDSKLRTTQKIFYKSE